MTDISTIRHDSIFTARKYDSEVTIIGAGAIGSRLWLALVELGVTEITTYDFDVIEPHNLANQIYMYDDIGQTKLDGLARYYTQKTGSPIPDDMVFKNERVTAGSEFIASTVVFLAVDTMEARKEIAEYQLEGNPRIEKVIDLRMASSHGDVISFDPNNRDEYKRWKDTLFSDEDGEVSPCGGSISVSPTASVLTNLAVWQYILHHTDPIAVDPKINIHLKPLILSAA